MKTELQFAKHFAYQAGCLLESFFQSADLNTRAKSDHTAVTEADLAADQLLSSAIRQHYPEDLLISEESQHHQPASPDKHSPQATWIIDPLDGTTNFSLGLPIWGVLIARLLDGIPDLAVLYFPHLAELYHAQRGMGAFMNDAPIEVLPPDPVRPFSFFACCSRTFRNYNVKIPYKARILGSAAYSLCAVARGLAVIGFEATPKIWDIAGAWLLVEEAGGCIQTLDGSQPFPFRPSEKGRDHYYPTIAAASPDLIEKSLKQIIPL